MLLVLLGGCLGTEETPTTAPQAVRVVQVRQGSIVEGRRYLAEVAPERAVRVLAQVKGTVSALPVEEGGLASTGAVLARIAAPDVGARLSRVRAERRRAEEARDHACSLATTDRELARTGDVPTVQRDTSTSACTSAQLAVEVARAGEDEAVVTSARSSERAPFDGQVLENLVEVGQTVMPGTTLVQFGSAERELRLRVPEHDLADVGIGTAAVGELGRGEVVAVGGWAKGPGRVVDVRIALDDPAGLALVGRTLMLRLVVDEREDSTSVPLAAIGEDAGGPYVLVVSDDGAERLAVTPGPREEGWVAIDPTLPVQTRVVVGDLDAVDPARPVLAVEVGS